MKPYRANAAAIALALLGVVFFALSAGAQDNPNALERAQDRKALAKDKAEIAHDAAALDRLSDLVLEWNRARKIPGNEKEASLMMERITAALKRDLKEDAGDVAQAGVEKRQSTRELASERREVTEDRREAVEAAKAGNPVEVAKEKRDLRTDRRDRGDDRRDRRDDARDRREIEKLLADKHALAVQLVGLQRQIDAGTGSVKKLQNKQGALLNKYLALSEKEIKMGVREMREDRRELREDRRETRDDRRKSRG